MPDTASARTRLEAARRAVLPFLERIAGKPEVEGVVILSSAALTGDRVTFDESSDFDLSVFVRTGLGPQEWSGDAAAVRRGLRSRLPGWLPDFSFDVPVPWGAVELNVHQRIFEYDADARTVWDEPMREAHAHTAEIFFDRTGAVRRLIEDKTRWDPAERRARLIRLLARLEWDVRRLPRHQMERGENAGAHSMVTAAVEEVVEVAHLLGRRYLPHRKWQLRSARVHGLATDAELELLESALLCRDFSAAELERRMAAVESAWSSVAERLPAGLPRDCYRFYSANLSSNRQLLPETVAARISCSIGLPDASVRDVVNYLLPADLDELSRTLADPAMRLPSQWQAAASSLHAALKRTPEQDGAKL